jgi:hypothetical protein
MTDEEQKTERMRLFMDKILVDCDRDFKEYYVRPGTQVRMSDGGEYVVVMTVLGTELSKQFSDGKIWKLFSLVHIKSGVNYSHPMPVMSEGIVDIRKLMQMGSYPIQNVTFEVEQQGCRRYTVVDESKYIKSMIIRGVL